MLAGTYWMLVQAEVGTLYSDQFSIPPSRSCSRPGTWSWRYWKLVDIEGFRR